MKISKAQFRSLLARVEQRQEDDTIRLAREIHDDVSQQLTALSIELSLLEKRLGKNSEAGKVHELLELTGNISRSVKKAMNELRPKILDEFGLMPALKYECQRLGKMAERKIRFSAEAEDIHLPQDHASQIFRLIQEVLSHVLQWEKASEILVQARMKNSQLQLEVMSDGDGFSRECDEDEEMLWLLHMQETVIRLGGRMTLLSEQQRGRKIRFKIPIGKEEARD